MTSWQKPTADQVSRVKLLALRPEEERYFFSRLQNPLWIDALRAVGGLSVVSPSSSDTYRASEVGARRFILLCVEAQRGDRHDP